MTQAAATTLAAVIAAVTGLVTLFLTSLIANKRAKESRYYDSLEAERVANRSFRDERLISLRQIAAEFAAKAVTEVELATRAAKATSTPDNSNDSAVKAGLEAAHTDLLLEYTRLLLVSDSVDAQSAARLVVRFVWNERQEGLGLPRTRPRSPASPSAKKALRAGPLQDFTKEIRRELGMKANGLLDENRF